LLSLSVLPERRCFCVFHKKVFLEGAERPTPAPKNQSVQKLRAARFLEEVVLHTPMHLMCARKLNPA
jgi:hypothetical protein